MVIVTTFGRSGYLRRALDAGFAGYLLKDAPAPELAAAIRKVCAGGRAVAPELVLAGWEAADPLTDRERTVPRRAGEGRTPGEIARALHLSEAIGKLGAANRIEAARLARDRGWLQDDHSKEDLHALSAVL